MSRRHDQSYKLLFSLPLAVEHLVRGYIDGGLARELDFDRVEYLATERTGTGLTRSLADLVCRIHFRGSSRYLLFAAEFQSGVDRYMALRALAYVADAYRGLVGSKRRGRRLGPRGLLPPVLTVTIYNGRRPWTAPDDIFDLIEPVQGRLAGRQPRMPHQVLDLRQLARQRPAEVNVVSWMASLELDPSRGNVARVVREVRATYPGPEQSVDNLARAPRAAKRRAGKAL
ncbi:MAG: Rpn family recombination-promoting nuclease/putative transposase [Gemmatimonadetes bacterium]|nr:Rpn family recombination-promoting nuclease/putative transposase [Gemmatimonadota bacterium]